MTTMRAAFELDAAEKRAIHLAVLAGYDPHNTPTREVVEAEVERLERWALTVKADAMTYTAVMNGQYAAKWRADENGPSFAERPRP